MTCIKLVAVMTGLALLTLKSLSQGDGYIVYPASFSSQINNEFSPVFYRDGIVFCSDENDNSLVRYKNDNNRLFRIFFVKRRGNSGWTYPKLLAKEISSAFNDGPATFSRNGDTIYYSRNNSIVNSMRNISDPMNKLGIYSAGLKDGKWSNIRPFEYNDPRYSFTTPSLAPDGKRIYFSSDMPGGYGRMDLYYCEKRNDGWDRPVNLGPVINTPGNELFPFACGFGKLFFASEGHKGYGGKDIFYTQQINGEWITPVHLDSAINSPSDDFGLVADSTLENGYFSSNRRNTDDIFSFSLPPVRFTSCDSIRENKYCFTFFDEKQALIDTIKAIYTWNFGNGIIRTGKEVRHCFPGPGKYTVKLTITDELTGDTLARQVEYRADLENIEQAYLKSADIGLTDMPVSFEGITADLKGFGATDYFWDLGEGFKPGGSGTSMTFDKKGDYIIRLGLLGKKDSSGAVSGKCVMKKIRIFNSYQEITPGRPDSGGKNPGAVSPSDSVKILQARIFIMGDMPAVQRARIEKALQNSGENTIEFDRLGIRPGASRTLENIALILKGNPALKLYITAWSANDNPPGRNVPLCDMWARTLLFYFRTMDIGTNRICSKGCGPVSQAFIPYVPGIRSTDGVLDFIFINY